MKNTQNAGIFLSLFQIAGIIALNFIVPLSDGVLVFTGIALIIAAYFLKMRYSGWVIVLSFPVSYVAANLLDTPHPFDGRLPNNLYPLWYLIFIGGSIAFLTVEGLLRFCKEK